MSARLVAPVLALLACSGCASAFGTFLDPVPYAGAQVDVALTGELAKRPSAGVTILAPIDLLPSIALDTVLLPVTLPIAAARRRFGWHAPLPRG